MSAGLQQCDGTVLYCSQRSQHGETRYIRITLMGLLDPPKLPIENVELILIDLPWFIHWIRLQPA